MRPLAKRTKGVYPPLLEGMRDPRRHKRAGIASAHHPPALKTTARSEFPLELVDLATPSPSRSQARALSKASASITTVVLGQTFNLRVIAEGVETDAQAEFLRSINCDEMQGYLFSKPLPAKEIENMFRARAG